MNAIFKQDARLGKLTTVLGKDVLGLLRFDGHEHVNGLSHYRIEAVSSRNSIDADKLLGTHATVELGSFDQPKVFFDGIVTQVQLLGPGHNGWRTELILQPWMWLLSLRRKQQIYHNMTVVQILGEVFKPWAKDVDNRLTRSYPKLEYTVQYRESDLDFVTRLMERFGINTHFTHRDGGHSLVLTDGIEAHDKIPGGTRPCLGVSAGHRADEEHFWEMCPTRRLTTGAVRLTDYNFKSPALGMERSHVSDASHAQGQIESYDYPGDYLQPRMGQVMTRLRLQQEQSQGARHQASGDCASLRAGRLVKVTGEASSGVGETVCLSAHHSFAAGGYGTDTTSGDTYVGTYELMPAGVPLRPEVKTPRAKVAGPQTATVVGEGEIDCDDLGRILVRFHWDLDKRYSMRCRVSQNWAGNGWGGMVIPRIGMEVVVEFLEGDPDFPLVTGCVYNGKNGVPYALPEHKTRSTFRTDTHQGEGFNELRFEDKKGEEEIFVHAQKDRNEKIRNNHTERIDNNWVQSVGHNFASETHNNRTEVIGGDIDVRVGPAQRHAVAPDMPPTNTAGLTGMGDTFGANGGGPRGTGSYYITVDQDKTQTIGRDASDLVRQNKATEVRGNMRTVVDGTVLIDAGKTLTLQCGAVSLVMEANGTLTINGNRATVTMDQIITLLADAVKIN